MKIRKKFIIILTLLTLLVTPLSSNAETSEHRMYQTCNNGNLHMSEYIIDEIFYYNTPSNGLLTIFELKICKFCGVEIVGRPIATLPMN